MKLWSSLRNRISRTVPAVGRIPKYVFTTAGLSGAKIDGISYVSEGQSWTIDLEGDYAVESCRKLGFSISRTPTPRFLTDRVIHFGSLWTFVQGFPQVNQKHNRTVTTLFHGNKGTDKAFDAAIAYFEKHQKELDAVVVSNTTMKARVQTWGVPLEKLHLIPIGIDLKLFSPVTVERRAVLRQEYGVPKDAICIGSFQKDGDGWGEGMNPKWVKGPDTFLKVCEQLKKEFPLFILLSGPACGYVKQGLERLGIPYRHCYLKDYSRVADLYHCLDLYLVTSREEGGPKAVMESMATRVPFVTTRVGMAIDLVENEKNGIMTEVDDLAALIAGSRRLIVDADLRRRLLDEGEKTVKIVSWENLGKQYAALYESLGAHRHQVWKKVPTD